MPSQSQRTADKEYSNQAKLDNIISYKNINNTYIPNISEFPPIYNSTQPNITQTLPSSLFVSYADKVNANPTNQSKPATDIPATGSALQTSTRDFPPDQNLSQNLIRQTPELF